MLKGQHSHSRAAVAGLAVAALGATAGVSRLAVAHPIGIWTPSGRAPLGPQGGPLLGVEGGGALSLATSTEPVRGSFGFGARAGWALPNGIAAAIRYDDLGVRPSAQAGPLQLATAGLRYSLPFVVPLPFAEVDAGAAFTGRRVGFGAAGGLGLSIPVGSLVLVDFLGRDWLVPIGGVLRQTLMASLGITVTFASPSR